MKLIILIGMLFSVSVFAQKNRRVCFVNNQGQTTREASDYVRIVEEPEREGEDYTIYEYYGNGNLRLKGKASSLDDGTKYTGPVTSYYANGNRKDIVYYRNGHPCDSAFFYHPDGTLNKVIYIPCDSVGEFDPLTYHHLLVRYFDRNGKETVSNGNGYCLSEDSLSGMAERGSYVNGLREGEWQISRLGHKAVLNYEKGKFVDGIAYWSDGTHHKIKKLHTKAQFNGEISNLNRLVDDKLNCPALKGTDIPQTLAVTFMVGQNGKISKVKFNTPAEYKVEDIVSSALQDVQAWIPATMNGLPVPSECSVSLVLR